MNSTQTRVESTTGMNVPNVESPIAKKCPIVCNVRIKTATILKFTGDTLKGSNGTVGGILLFRTGECEYCA